MAIIKQGILGGFKKKIGSVVGSSWKGVATMRSLPLSVANPRTAAQVENRDRFKACAEFASLILASIIKPLMDRFAGQMSGYNYFTKLNKEVWANPLLPTWSDLVISKGRMVAPTVTASTTGGDEIVLSLPAVQGDRFASPTDVLYVLIYNATQEKIVLQGATAYKRSDRTATLSDLDDMATNDKIKIYVAYLRADGSEVSNSGYVEITA